MATLNVTAIKARSGWLFSFGDVITLLITFFIMMIVLNKGEITRLQKWTEQQLDTAYVSLETSMESAEFVSLTRNSDGIVIDINPNEAFVKGGFEPTPALEAELETLGRALESLVLFDIDSVTMPEAIADYAREQRLEWRPEISVAGHTDNDKIDGRSTLRNNWFLSTMRAQSVMQILYRTSQLDQSLFGVAGYGEYRPIASNAEREGKMQNRRIQIVVAATFETHFKNADSLVDTSKPSLP